MKPFTTKIELPSGLMTHFNNHVIRKLSDMNNYFYDSEAYNDLLSKGDIVLYEVYENNFAEVAGELPFGTDIIHTGKVGDEFFMTKGHFHKIVNTAEIYYCLQGHGIILLENLAGDWHADELYPGSVLYVPPKWAHRSINIGNDDLINLYVCPGNAGHDYRSIETKGFKKLIIERDGHPKIIDNPKWK